MTTETLEFATKLLSKTKIGKVPWAATYDPLVFLCVLDGQITVEISHPDTNYSIEMKDETQTSVFRENEWPPTINSSQEEDQAFRLLEELFERARRNALKIDEKLKKASQLLDRL